MHRKRVWSLGLIVLAGLVLGLIQGTSAQTAQRYFPETGQWLRGRFLQYWESHGGLAQQGYPLTDEFAEQSAAARRTRSSISSAPCSSTTRRTRARPTRCC